MKDFRMFCHPFPAVPARGPMLFMPLLLGLATLGYAAEPIEGEWRTAHGETVAIAPCAGAFCLTVQTGEHKGKNIGSMSGQGTTYKGHITDPADHQTYDGSASVEGNVLRLKGCVMKLLCESQRWARL